MTTYSTRGFYIIELGCNVHATPGSYDYYVNKIKNPIMKQYYFKTSDEYFKYIIDKLKDGILRTIPDLQFVNIQIHAFDKNNMLHRLIITVKNILHGLFTLREQIHLRKMAYIVIKYKNIPIFLGGTCFDGIV